MNDKRAYVLTTPQVRERSLIRNVYVWMTAGLGVTAVVAYLVAATPAIMSIILSNQFLFFGIVIAELALVFYLSSRLKTMDVGKAVASFIGYAILNGVLMSTLFYVFTGGSIAIAFFTTTVAFGGMSVFAMLTKRDLRGFGYYFSMALWGLIIASLINMFLGSQTMYYIISFVGIIVFLGLTAWDTQRLRDVNEQYGTTMTEEEYTKISIISALSLYLNFINIFLYILRFMGVMRRD
ncbi:Bax inhibitor-1/YccA family protein [Parasphaerochaeta coccoides]|uniref:Integral membrane protein n=1 Tax=Parasphaerochaeta coccoides (strain ATCC BAA-1237 / DSM 17374 / SPN1) TaxID=760011 RepID=F4GHB5_PARC1|nr:Bax inhibitor-1/YccA family protein [Parasphaerochaeta coccoides]AEC02014.1 protein of unknown function UPF0005 [Parasphaerochaeta coccoides DSM 17374]